MQENFHKIALQKAGKEQNAQQHELFDRRRIKSSTSSADMVSADGAMERGNTDHEPQHKHGVD
jgi:hypothetical protein